MGNFNKLKLVLLIVVVGVVLGLINVAIRILFDIDHQSTLSSLIAGGVMGGGSVFLIGVVNRGVQKGKFQWFSKECD